MSIHMLVDSNRLNKYNPYAVEQIMNMPGTVNASYSYTVDTPKDPQSISSAIERSPLCDVGLTSGDRTIDFCNPGKPNCPMERSLVPERIIDPGFTDYYNRKFKCATCDKKANETNEVLKLIVLVVVALLIMHVIKNM